MTLRNYFTLRFKVIYLEWWCTEANEATQTYCYNPVAPAYPVWAYCAHGRQCRCQENPVGLPSGRLEKTARSSPHHMTQHRPTGSETTPPYTPRSSRFCSEPPSVEDDVDVWRYAILSCMPEMTMIRSSVHHTASYVVPLRHAQTCQLSRTRRVRSVFESQTSLTRTVTENPLKVADS